MSSYSLTGRLMQYGFYAVVASRRTRHHYCGAFGVPRIVSRAGYRTGVRNHANYGRGRVRCSQRFPFNRPGRIVWNPGKRCSQAPFGFCYCIISITDFTRTPNDCRDVNIIYRPFLLYKTETIYRRFSFLLLLTFPFVFLPIFVVSSFCNCIWIIIRLPTESRTANIHCV